MNRFSSSLQLVSCLFFSVFLLNIPPGLADSPSTSNGAKASSKKTWGSSTWLKISLIYAGLLAVAVFSVSLYKLWQRKKREAQHAAGPVKRFEQDDKLEVELGIRD